MANPWDNDPVLAPFDAALAHEGVTGKLADVARSIYQQESGGGKNTTTSNAGAVGGMQIIPGTFNSVADKGWNIADPVHNARAGIRYLKQLDKQSGGDAALTAAGYYGGPGGMEKARKGVAVSDPRNPKAPNTLEYGQQVAARLPKNPVVAALNSVTDAVLPSANAAQGNPWDKDEIVQAPKPAAKAESGGLLQGAGNLVAGAVRGAGSIGATLLAPYDMAKDALAGKGLSLESNRERRAGMDGGLQELGAQPDSWMYKGGKLAGEIAGTAGAGGLVANGVSKVAPAAVTGAPKIAQLLEAIKTGGFSLGGSTATTLGGKAAELGIRTLGGAISGGATAGLVDPEQAKGGAIVGGILPGATQAAGVVTNKLGSLIRGPEQSADAISAIKAARDAGYVIPPTQAKPTLTNRLLEGFSGKITTAQNASAKNADVTNALANKALGLADDVKLTPEVLQDVRKAAGQAYDALGQAGTITPGASYNAALDKIASSHVQAAAGFPNAKASPVLDLVESLRSPAFDASSAIAKIKELRSGADDAFRTGNTDVGLASKSAATALEDAIEQHLQQSGASGLLQQFKDARQLIAKSYSVEKALNVTTGAVDARKLGGMLPKGKPLSDELRQAGEFANRFPKAAQTVERMGSLPQTSPLDWAAGGAISAATANPLALIGVAARPAARALTLSNLVQNNLAKPQSSNRLLDLLSSPEGQQLLARMAPQAATSR